MKSLTRFAICTLLFLTLFTFPLESQDGGKTGPIPWVKDLAMAKALSKKTDKPIIVHWKGGNETEERKNAATRKWTPQEKLDRVNKLLFPPLVKNPRTQKFVWLKIEFEKDKDTVKFFGINEHWKKYQDHVTWPVPSGFVFANAEGKVYGRFGGEPMHETFDDMMIGVLKAHSPLGSRIRATPYPTRIKYKPLVSTRLSREAALKKYGDGWGGPPAKFTPHPQSWRKCDTCKAGLKKALGFINKYPKLGWKTGAYTAVALMLAGEGYEGNLKNHIAKARKAAQPHWGGYSNWEISLSMVLLCEYSIRYGLTEENRKVLETAVQFAAENADTGGGWFHHPKHGGSNYAWDIGMIGAMYNCAFLEMQGMGFEVQPALSVGRGYLERLSGFRGQNFGYGTPKMGSGHSSCGKNGFVMMGFYAGGRANEDFPRLLGDFLNDYPDGFQTGHASPTVHAFGASVGFHRRSPESYATFAGVWLHQLLSIQKDDGSIGGFPHDMNVPGIPVLNASGNLKSGGNAGATAILATMILMTEPGVFYATPFKPKGSLANSKAFAKAEKLFAGKNYIDAYTHYAVVLPPGDSLHLVPTARAKMRMCTEKICVDEGERRKITQAMAVYPAETRAQAGIDLYRKHIGKAPVISSVNIASLSAPAKGAYALIQRGSYHEGLTKIKELRPSATDYDRQSYDSIEKFVLANIQIRIEQIDASFDKGDVYELSNNVVKADKTCKGVEIYEKEVAKARDLLAEPESVKLITVGTSHNKLTISGETLHPMTYLTKLDAFAKLHEDNIYGVMAENEAKPKRDEIDLATLGMFELMENSDPYNASINLAKCDKKYRNYKPYDEISLLLHQSLKTKGNVALKKIGKQYYRLLADKTALSKPGSFIIKLEVFKSKNDNFYGTKASDKLNEVISAIDDVVKNIEGVYKTGDVYLASEQLIQKNRAYGKNKTFVEKSVDITAKIKSNENRLVLKVGKKYYKMMKKKSGKKKDKEMASFKKKYGDTYYGKLLK